MVAINVVKPSETELASPVVLAPKKDGTLRICVDYRKLNAIPIRDLYRLPIIDERIESPVEAQVF